MNALQCEMLRIARKLHGKIFKPVRRKTWESSFTEYAPVGTILWFNTPDTSTHILSEKDFLREIWHEFREENKK